MILLGMVFPGYCGGAFGRDAFGPKRVEAFGVDWVIVRGPDGRPNAAFFADSTDMLNRVAEWLQETGEMW